MEERDELSGVLIGRTGHRIACRRRAGVAAEHESNDLSPDLGRRNLGKRIHACILWNRESGRYRQSTDLAVAGIGDMGCDAKLYGVDRNESGLRRGQRRKRQYAS